MIKVRDKWFRFVTVLLPVLLVVYTNDLCLHATAGKLLRSGISFACILLICEGNRFLIYSSRRWKLPWSKAPRRILTVITTGLLYTTLVLALTTVAKYFTLTDTFNLSIKLGSQVRINNDLVSMGLFAYSFFNAIFTFFFLLAGYETLYRYALLRHTEKEKEILEKEKLRAELNQLKGIINPHFLFNNLNSLSSLITEDPRQAEAFLDELTKVFRYLLRNNQAELTTLGQELQFIQSYYHLLQTRYGAGLDMKILIDQDYHDWRIPPLTLQLLVENAVKHNALQKESPLHIELLSTDKHQLIVRNSLSQKESPPESTGIGLQSINTRYKMLNLPELTIRKTEHHFTAIIPLIQPDTDLAVASQWLPAL